MFSKGIEVLSMKQILSLFAGLAFLLAFGLAYAADDKVTGDMRDKMITNDDLPQSSGDQDSSTFNQMPADPGIKGSAAGGVSSGTESLDKDSDQTKEPVEKTPTEPDRKEPGRDMPGTDTDRPGY